MHTLANEWAAKVSARNEVETARAEGRRTMMLTQLTFDRTGGGAAITQERLAGTARPTGMTPGL